MTSDYISLGESRKIARENRREIKRFEAAQKKLTENDALTTMRNPQNCVEFDNLKTYFFTDAGTVKAVDGISFDIPQGKIVGVVGESGCGKSSTSLSLMQLLQKPQGQIVDGAIRFAHSSSPKSIAYDLTKASPAVMQRLRGNSMAMIFQEPMTSLNPVLRIGEQIDEVIFFHKDDLLDRKIIADAEKASIKQRTIKMLELTGISNAEGVYAMFPHELSGGMMQRVMISMALVCSPSLIIADEPTTALDVTIQAQILELLSDLKTKINASIMLITHDLGVIAGMADFVVVMYAGRIVERGTARDIFSHPAHPYTIGLMRSKPVLNRHVERLYSIPGSVPNPVHLPSHCYFRGRCEYASGDCDGCYPAERSVSASAGAIENPTESQTHFVSCRRTL
ncbi:MAG: ABC transporter ATP-binding protein [Treponemataceae bacterium]|nr:MAG: ABC transporter ATP-binding protein [Treponemataceae bacterium]